MLEILLGASIGIIVCFFGIWCFIRGQQNGIQIANKEVPTQINNPITAITEAIQEVKETNAQNKENENILSIQEQYLNAAKGINNSYKDGE